MAYTTLPTYDELYKKNLESFKAAQDEKIAENNKIYAAQTDYAKQLYNTQINAAESSYSSAIDKNEVQRLINEKQIAESMANMGLTASGLNRTQSTAVALSAANNRNAISLQRQQALDNLKLELSGTLTDIENSRASAEMSIKSGYEQEASTAATSQYNTLSTQYTEAIEAAEELQASRPLYYYKRSDTVYDSENNPIGDKTVTFYDSSTGKETKVQEYVNPYTGKDARLTYKAEYEDPNIGFFKLADGVNGYQPRGLQSEGGKFKAVTTSSGNYITYNLYGKDQKIWKSPNGNYFYWNGSENRYEPLSEEFVNQVIAAAGG